MNKIIESILLNTKEAYKESVIIDNEKLQNILLDTLTLIRTLQNSSASETIFKDTKKRYSYEQVVNITKIQIKLANNIIGIEDAKKEILKIAEFFPVHNLNAYNKRLLDYLSGVGTYGFAMPTNWAKALLQETNNDKKVLKALREQQDLYMQKDGTSNKKLTRLLDETEQAISHKI